MIRPRLTLTGIDEHTDLVQLEKLARQWYAVEWAVLWSEQEGTKGTARYPVGRRIIEALEIGQRQRANGGCAFAVHACGRAARLAFLRLPRGPVQRSPMGEEERGGHLAGIDLLVTHVVEKAGRVQLNGAVPPELVGRASGLCSHIEIITQFRWFAPADRVAPDEPLLSHQLPNHALLVDASGGRGHLPSAWARPRTTAPVGFAGGLSPENIPEQLPRILDEAQPTDWWIDMESSLRVDDVFSLERAEQAILATERVLNKRGMSLGRRS